MKLEYANFKIDENKFERDKTTFMNNARQMLEGIGTNFNMSFSFGYSPVWLYITGEIMEEDGGDDFIYITVTDKTDMFGAPFGRIFNTAYIYKGDSDDSIASMFEWIVEGIAEMQYEIIKYKDEIEQRREDSYNYETEEYGIDEDELDVDEFMKKFVV